MKMENGVCVLHLFCSSAPHTDANRVRSAAEAFTATGGQLVVARMLGHRAELCLMAIASDIDAVFALQTELRAAHLELVDSYLSITEVSEYAPNLPPEMLQDRLYPNLPPEGKPAFCFYPMSKSRDAHANWYATAYDRRRDMMYEHGSSGRKFAGRIVQLITGSTGLDTHEWGVTLFAVSLEVIKDVVYTMRFDEASALYGVFGDFWVGEVTTLDDALATLS